MYCACEFQYDTWGLQVFIWGPSWDNHMGAPINIWGILLFTGVPQLQKYIVPVTLEPPYVIEKPDTLQWRHNGCDDVSNIQPHDCLLNRLFTGRITGPLSCLCGEFADHQFVRGIHWWSRSVNSPHTHDKGPVIRVLFSFDDVIMNFKKQGQGAWQLKSQKQSPISRLWDIARSRWLIGFWSEIHVITSQHDVEWTLCRHCYVMETKRCADFSCRLMVRNDIKSENYRSVCFHYGIGLLCITTPYVR